MITYTFVGLGTCRAYPLTWLGYVPSMLAMVSTSVSNGWAMTPSKPHDDNVLQVRGCVGVEGRGARCRSRRALRPVHTGAAGPCRQSCGGAPSRPSRGLGVPALLPRPLLPQVWLQEFCWTEGQEEQRKKAERASSLPPGSAGAAAIDKEPMFCMEVGGAPPTRPYRWRLHARPDAIGT